MRWKVLSMADITPCPDVFQTVETIADVDTLPASQELLLSSIENYHAYFAGLKVRADRDVLERARNLRVIVTPTTGLDHIDMNAARQRGVVVISNKDDIELLSKITATAEMTWGLLLAVVRRLPWSFEAARSGEWARHKFRGRQLSGKTLGILGYGRLGRMMGEYGAAFRMRVLVCDHKPVDAAPYVTMVDFPTLLRESDVLSLHIHLTPENYQIINRDALAQMKAGAILLNSSRGAIIDEAALLESLQGGHLGGAGLDVIDGEWLENLSEHPLIRYANAHENLVISPHTGGITHESEAITCAHSVAKLKSFLENLQP